MSLSPSMVTRAVLASTSFVLTPLMSLALTAIFHILHLQAKDKNLSDKMGYFWHYHTSNHGHDHILIILKTMSIIKYGVPGILCKAF